MGSQRKVHRTGHQLQAEKMLAARTEMLKTKGFDDAKIKRDATIRKIKADINHTKRQLDRMAKQEKLNAELAQAKIDKLEAKKNPPPAAPEKPVNVAPAAKPKAEKKVKEKPAAKPAAQE
jgi:hypothetical protein